MPKYLVKASYTAEGVKGLLKDGGSKRRDAAKKLVESVGGKLECFYFAFGDADAILIADFPDAAAATAASLAVNASGALRLSTTALTTPEDVDKAAKMSVPYKAPGH
jgi:uncharacterized protein with GYD domain